MIDTLPLITAQQPGYLNATRTDLPSRQQLLRLRIGDEVRLKSHDLPFWCTVTARDGNALLGRMSKAVPGLPAAQDDPIAFGLHHIYEVRPGATPPVQVPDWLLAQPYTGHLYYLLRTKLPALLASAEVKPNGLIIMKLLRLYEQPNELTTDLPKLLDGGRRWLTDNYLKKTGD